MMNVLVTGGNGQLASCIKDIQHNYPTLNFIYTDYKELDVSNFNQVQSFFSNLGQIDYCINCAAYTAVDKAEEDKEKAFEINALGAKNLALACKENDVILIHISTDFVFDGEKNIPYNEKDTPKPINVYGKTKLLGEVAIQNILKEHFILRTSWLYSEYGNNFMKTMLRLSKEKEELNIVSDQIGTPTYAKDLSKVIFKLIIEKNRVFGVYHYSNEGVASWYDFAISIFEEKNIKIKINPVKTEAYLTDAERPKFSVLDKDKIKTLGIDIPYWRDSLKNAIIN